MRALKQLVTVTLVGLYTIPQRLSSSIVAVVGIAGVVVVLVAVLSIGEGFKAAMVNAGHTDRAIVMRSGADSEMSSGLSGPETELIKQAPGIQRNGSTPAASAEMFVVIDVKRRSSNTDANVPLRGVDSTALAVRTEAKIDGRMLQFGTNEVVVGRAASRQFIGLNIGDVIHAGQVTWNVVGTFDTGGTVAETEIWCDARVLQGAYRRGNSYQSMLVKLDSPASFDPFKDWLTKNPQLDVQVQRESDYYAQQSTTLTQLVKTIGYGVAFLMGLGAIIGAVLTMYSGGRDADA